MLSTGKQKIMPDWNLRENESKNNRREMLILSLLLSTSHSPQFKVVHAYWLLIYKVVGQHQPPLTAQADPVIWLNAEELMLPNCGAGEDSWESLELQQDQTNPPWRKSMLNIHWKYWCWSSNTLATWCKEPTHWKRPGCWGSLTAKEGSVRGSDG